MESTDKANPMIDTGKMLIYWFLRDMMQLLLCFLINIFRNGKYMTKSDITKTSTVDWVFDSTNAVSLHQSNTFKQFFFFSPQYLIIHHIFKQEWKNKVGKLFYTT